MIILASSVFSYTRQEINLNITDHLSAEMKPQQKRINYFPKLNSVVKYPNTGSKYSKLSPKQQFKYSWCQPNCSGTFALQTL